MDEQPGAETPDARSRRIVRPIQALLEHEASSAILMVAAALIALVWANSAWSASYRSFWSTELSPRVGALAVEETLRGWVNDGLMTAFFLLVALEIKREIVIGELRDRRAAVLPVFGALGGMSVPALVFLAIAGSGPGRELWGAAMPTDIAFALGILTLAAPNVPASVKVFLLGVAIVDDLATVVVLAVAYQRGIGWLALAGALAVVLVAVVLLRFRVRATWVYAALGVALWLTLHEAAVSPALAGVVIGFLTPATAPGDAVPPLARLERAVLPVATWVALPLFALANAGVEIPFEHLGAVVREPVVLGMIVARVVGKPVGIALGVAAALTARVARRPEALSPAAVLAVGAAASIPFAVSLFVAGTAGGPTPVELGSFAVLASAFVAAGVGFVAVRRAFRRR